MSSDLFNQTGNITGTKNNSSKNNNQSKTNSNSLQNSSINNESCNSYNKDLQSSFEKMKQQLDLRKLFLNKVGVNDEKEIFSGENFQQNLQFEISVATFVQKKQLENNRQKQYQNTSSSPLLESPDVQIINEFNKSKGNLDGNDNRHEEVKYDPYNTLYYLRQDQLIAPLTSGESSPSPSDDDDTFKGSSSANQKGNKSINTKIPQSTNLEDLLLYMIDSNLLQMEKEPQVQRATKSDRSTSWKNCYELLFNNVNVHLSYATLKKEMRDRFKTFIFIQIDKFRTLYYQGKYSFLVRFSEENNAQFVYFNYKKNQQQYRTVFGENLEVYKVNENNIDFYYYGNTLPNSYNQTTKTRSNAYWVPVVVRNLPFNFDRANLNHFLQSINVLKSVQNIEEFIVLNEKKHTMIVFSDMESALRTILQIPIKFKDLIYVRANLHPNFTKLSWTNKNIKENPHYAFYKVSQDNNYYNSNDTPGYSDIQTDSVLKNLQNSKICQYFQFKKSFLEDILNINKKYNLKKGGDKEDDLKKLSQRSTTPIYHHEKLNMEIEHQERFVIQKSSIHSDDTPSPRKNINNSYLDNIPSTESFKKQSKGITYEKESSFYYQKQQTSDQKSKNYSKKQNSKGQDSYKEERYKTPSLDSKHSRSKERRFDSDKKQDQDQSGGNQTTERNYKSYTSKTRRKNQYSKSRSNSRAGREQKKSQKYDDNNKNDKRRTQSPQSDQNERNKNYNKQDKYKNKSHESKNDESNMRNDDYQCISDSEEKRKSENQTNNSINQDEELRKYFENQGKQQTQQEQKDREDDDKDQTARTPQSDDWGLSNHNERSSRCSENRLNGHEDDDLLQLNIEEQINKQFMNMFDKKDNIEENQKSPKTKKSNCQKVKFIKEDDHENKYHQREGKHIEIEEEKSEEISIQTQIEQKLNEKIKLQQDISQKINITQQANQQQISIEVTSQSQNQQKEDILNVLETAEKDQDESQNKQDSENKDNQILNQQPNQAIQKQKSILKAIEQSDDDDDSSMSNSRNSSPISSSGSIKSQSYKNRQSSNNERKGSPTHQNQRREQYQKNNKNYNKNYQNNYKYNYHNNYQNRYNNYNQNMGNSHFQGNYRNNYNSQMKGNNQLNRTRSRSNSNSRYPHKRPHELSNNGSGQNSNQFNRFNNQNNNRKFYKRGSYHDNYHNQYNNQYGNQYNRHRSSSRNSKRSYSNHSSERKSPSHYKKKSIQRSESKSQTRNQNSSSKSRQAKCSKTPTFTKENLPVNQIDIQQKNQNPQQDTSAAIPSESITLNQQNSKENRSSNQRQNSESRSSSQRKQSESNKRQSVSDNNKSYKKMKKQSNSPSQQKNDNEKDDKSPSSEEGEYDENHLSTYNNHQYRQREGYQRNYKNGGNFYRKDMNNNNFKKNRPFNYNNTNIYNDRRGQQRESFSPEKNKERRSQSLSPRSRQQKQYNKRDNEAYKKNQRDYKSPSSPYTPPAQNNYYNENRLKYNNYQKGYHKYNNNQQNDDRYKYNSKYNNHINYNKQQKSRSRSRSPYKNMNSQKGAQQKYN